MRQRFYEKGGRESIVVVNGTQLLLLFTTTTMEAFTKIKKGRFFTMKQKCLGTTSISTFTKFPANDSHY